MLTPEKISELKSKHGDKLAMVTTPLGELVFRKPDRAAYDKWSDDNAAGKPRSGTARELAQHCLVFPEWVAFVAILDELPGLLNGEISTACTMHCGLVETYEVKKL
jgi:hypothetical protein